MSGSQPSSHTQPIYNLNYYGNSGNRETSNSNNNNPALSLYHNQLLAYKLSMNIACVLDVTWIIWHTALQSVESILYMAAVYVCVCVSACVTNFSVTSCYIVPMKLDWF